MMVVRTSFRVGYRWRCEMSIDAADIMAGAIDNTKCEWSPRLPAKLSDVEMQDYRRGRDRFYGEIARLIGGNVMVLEPGADGVGMTVIKPASDAVRQ